MSRILVVSGFWPTTVNTISGIFVVQQVAALCRAGCSVTVMVGKEVWKRKERHLSIQAVGLPGDKAELREVSIVRAPESLSDKRQALAFNVRSIGHSISRSVAALSREMGVPLGTIVHGLRYFTMAAPYWAAGLASKKIAVVHGIDPFLQLPHVRGLIQAYLQGASKCIDAVALVGSSLREHTASLGIDPFKTVVIPNGTELPALSYLPPARTAPDRVLNIVSVSNLIALKGIDDNLRALRLLNEQYGMSDWCYRVIGEGPDRGRLEALAAALGLKGQTSFLGRLAYDDTMREIAEADIFSLPSWAEAFGIVYLEAMARQRPAIGCFGNGAADIISNGKDGFLVPPRDPEALALKFKRLFEDPGLRTELGRQGRGTAEKYTWDVNARRVLEALGL